MLKKRSATRTVVPCGQATRSTWRISPPSTLTRTPGPSQVPVVSSMRDTEAILASASPRNPSVVIASRSLSVATLLVACWAKASSTSTGSIPCPSSTTSMSAVPASSSWTEMRPAPASNEFSISSLITDAGRSTTSPAAMRSITSESRMWMLLIVNVQWIALKADRLMLGQQRESAACVCLAAGDQGTLPYATLCRCGRESITG